MIRYLPLAVCLAVIIVTGCGELKPPKSSGRGAMMIASTQAKNPRAIVTGTLLRRNARIVSDQIHRIEVAREIDSVTKRYVVLFGPFPESSFQPTTQPGEGVYLGQPPYFFLASGWGIVSGDWPLAETDLVTAAAEGTTFVLQIDGAVHRVILIALSGSETIKVDRKASPGSPFVWTSTVDSYIEYRAGDPWPPTTMPVANNEELELFVKVALERAAAAGLPDAPTIRLRLTR